MDKAKSIDELISAIAAIRNLGKGFISNYFLDAEKHALWIEKGDCLTAKLGNTFFIVKDNPVFWNIFYNSTDTQSLKQDLETLEQFANGKQLVFDVVGRQKQIDMLDSAFSDNGYQIIRRLVRMSKMSDTEVQSDDCFEYAESTDIPKVLELLYQYFDPKTEQIPYKEELETLASANQVFVQKNEGKVLAFVVFEKNASTLYLRYWFVLPKYRGQRIGATLLRRMFTEGKDCKRHILWVVDDNHNAIEKYVRYGFKEEGLVDVVYSK